MLVALALVALLLAASRAEAFCGFYVGKADAKLFNEASQVILVRDGNRTVISMRNDFQGELSEFALVVPVPQVLSQKSQIHIGDPQDLRAHRRLQRAAARRVLRPESLPQAIPAARDAIGAERADAALVQAQKRASATRRSASPSRRATRSANTTS